MSMLGALLAHMSGDHWVDYVSFFVPVTIVGAATLYAFLQARREDREEQEEMRRRRRGPRRQP